jgi:3-mercaptopyruvate sulfurtransferase SseA
VAAVIGGIICQSGGRASVMPFGLELMGTKDVANYYAGWSEWGNADDTPIKTRGPSGAGKKSGTSNGC